MHSEKNLLTQILQLRTPAESRYNEPRDGIAIPSHKFVERSLVTVLEGSDKIQVIGCTIHGSARVNG
jgi:hypothetical protein